MVEHIEPNLFSSQNQQKMWFIRAKTVTMVPLFSCSAHDHGQLDLAHDLGIYPNKNKDVSLAQTWGLYIVCQQKHTSCVEVYVYLYTCLFHISILSILSIIYIYILFYIYIIYNIYIFIYMYLLYFASKFRCWKPLVWKPQPRPSYKVSQAAGFFDHWTMATWIVTLSFTSKSLITLLGRTQHWKNQC